MNIRVLLAAAGVAALLSSGAAEARGFAPIYQFQGSADGTAPVGNLLRDAAGNLYGASSGGSNNMGTVFVVSPGGAKTTLHTFSYLNVGDAAQPASGVVMDAAGNLYGEAVQGGSGTCTQHSEVNPDCGSVYKLATDGTLTRLYSFQGGTDGGIPRGGLLLDEAGNVYGTTEYGGTSDFCPGNCGTVFKIAPNGTETVLYNFQGQTSGGAPLSGLIRDKHHNLYGTTQGGGYGTGYGTVYKLAPNGAETVLYAFHGTDGSFPEGGVVMDAAGNLYGTTFLGGGSPGEGYGVVYKIDTGGTETVLHSFGAVTYDGRYPQTDLLIDKTGAIYGTTWEGGKGCRYAGCGVVFKVAADGTYSNLCVVPAGTAHQPTSGLVQDTRGHLFGAVLGRYKSASANLGIVYTLDK